MLFSGPAYLAYCFHSRELVGIVKEVRTLKITHGRTVQTESRDRERRQTGRFTHKKKNMKK